MAKKGVFRCFIKRLYKPVSMFTIPKALICPPLPGSLKHTADRKLEPYQIRLHYYQKRHRNTLLGFIPQSEHQS